MTATGACFRSSGYPDGNYGANEACDIVVSGSGFIKATAFQTEFGSDYLTIASSRFDGAGSYLTSAGVFVDDGATISWQSDGVSQLGGFEVCGVPCDDTCLGHGSCGGDGTACMCRGGYSGPNCEVRYRWVWLPSLSLPCSSRPFFFFFFFFFFFCFTSSSSSLMCCHFLSPSLPPSLPPSRVCVCESALAPRVPPTILFDCLSTPTLTIAALRLQFLPPDSAPPGSGDSYTMMIAPELASHLSISTPTDCEQHGVSVINPCGVFRRVAAHCTDTTQGYCPGGVHAQPDYTDPTMCDGVPVYQREGGLDAPVLYRIGSSGFTYWIVGPSDRLGDCSDKGGYYTSKVLIGLPSPDESAPDAVAYGWSDPGGYETAGSGVQWPIHIVLGDGGGGH